MKIVVVGVGYVGLSISILLAPHHSVIAVDIDEKRVENINNRKIYFQDKMMSEYLLNEKMNLTATTDTKNVYQDADYIVICVSTNFDSKNSSLDTSAVDTVIANICDVNKYANVIIKSTMPIGYTEKARKKYDMPFLFFSPEFLRENNALQDNLYPSRIIIGAPKELEARKRATQFALILNNAAMKEAPVLITGMEEAEAIKLFSNAFLAMRVSYFNEVDIFADVYHLNSHDIIKGMGLDPRIGLYYNNPSFGYGGYCLTKDTKQLESHYKDIPNQIIKSINESNEMRKRFIAKRIMMLNPSVIGIFRLIIKTDSDNIRQSAIIDILSILKEFRVEILIYEPLLDANEFLGVRVVKDLAEFKCTSDIIVTNRMQDELLDVMRKTYTRDIFYRD